MFKPIRARVRFRSGPGAPPMPIAAPLVQGKVFTFEYTMQGRPGWLPSDPTWPKSAPTWLAYEDLEIISEPWPPPKPDSEKLIG